MKIIPTILAYTKEGYESQLNKLVSIGDIIQIDVTDKNYGRETINIDKIVLPANKKIVFHLMVHDPLVRIEKYLKYNPVKIIVHAESSTDWEELAEKIDSKQLGIAINPDTEIDVVRWMLKDVSEILVMTVRPGEQGREMDIKQLHKATVIKHTFPNETVSIDGGINVSNIDKVAQAGIDIAYIGSAITKNNDPEKAYSNLINKLK